MAPTPMMDMISRAGMMEAKSNQIALEGIRKLEGRRKKEDEDKTGLKDEG
jgi:hypothetical protein